MSGLKYRDQFWGDKHHGYHTLYERFKAGDEAVYELEMLIKEHSAMQEDQLRALAKTLGKVTNFASSGTTQMVEAWSLTKSTLELLQEIQMASFKSLQEQSRELARYRAELAHSKKRVKEGECVEAVSLMQTTTTCLQKAKETYTARCAELDKLRADPAASAKEINKAEQKLGRARDEYRAYTDKYEMVRADFEERMEKSADAFEAHDLSHLSTLKAAFVAFATAQQEQAEAMANVQSQFRESLATISVQALMDRFCSECSTGGERPPHMPFESLEGGASSSAALLSPTAAAAAVAAAVAGDNQSVGSSGKVGGGAAAAQIVDLLSDDPLPVQLQPPVREEDVVLEEMDREETGRKEVDERWEELKEGENEEKKESEEKKVLKSEEWCEDWNVFPPGSKVEISGIEALKEVCAEGIERFKKAKGVRGRKEEDERREELKEGENEEKKESEEKEVLKSEEWCEDWNLASPRSKGEMSGMEALREVLNEERSVGGKERFEKAKGVRGRKDEKETPLSSSMSASFSASLGGSRQKLAMWLPGKRKKTSSVCSTDVAGVEGGTEGVASSSGGGGFLNKFGRSRRSNKSKTDLPGAVAGEGGGVGFDDAHSTASSSRSEDKPSCLLTHSLEPTQPTVDEEGFTIRGKEDDDAGAEEAKWASCSSDEDDEDASNSLQQSRIRTLTIRPETAAKPNASVDELRDAIGSISLARSSTFDKDPWSAMGGGSSMGRGGGGVGGASPSFSQSLGPGAFSPLRAATTGGYEHRAQFSEADFSRSNVPLSFSASLSFGGSMARARPRGSISQQGGGGGMDSTGQMITPSLTGDGRLQRHTESGSVFGSAQQQQQDCWGSQQMLAAEGGGERGFSGSTMNLMQATIAEQRVPIAAALNEYLHVWMKGAGVEDRTTRVFGTVLVSFAASSLPILTDSATDIEPLQLSLLEQRDEPGGAVATPIKQIVPNAKIVSVLPAKEGDAAAAAASAADPLHLQHDFTFDRAALAAWLQQQREERPQLAFFNLEVLRYELSLGTSITAEPPLLFTSYWKVTMLKEGEDEGGAFSQSNPTGRSHVDIRVDYRLNEACALLRGGASLTSIHFETKIGAPAAVANAVTEPAAEWDALTATLNWRLGELSLAGPQPASGASAASASGAAASSGSLKARVYLAEGSGAPPPAPTSVQFTAPSVSLSSSSLTLSPSSDTYHMSMLRRKVMAGKYFCEPQLRI